MLLPFCEPDHDRNCSPVQPGRGPDIGSRIGGCGCSPLHGWLLHAAGVPLLGHHKANVSVCYKLESEAKTHMDATRSLQFCLPSEALGHAGRLGNRIDSSVSCNSIITDPCMCQAPLLSNQGGVLPRRHGGRAPVPNSARAIDRHRDFLLPMA